MGFGLLEKLIEINCVEINPLSLEDAILDYDELVACITDPCIP